MVDLERLYASSDYISLHLAVTAETKNLLNREAFAKMKDGVRIINCARGELIDEAALEEALQLGQGGRRRARRLRQGAAGAARRCCSTKT